MNEWEQDPDAWKNSEEKKPWEDEDAWKLEEGYQPGETEIVRNPHILRSLEVTVGVRPTVPVLLLDWDDTIPTQISVKNRDELKEICQVANLQKALTEEGELFQYSSDRNMWIRIPWETLS